MQEGAAPAETTARTIVCADDDAVIRQLLTSTLRRAGHTVVAAEDGPRAIQAVREHNPDLVILDLRLPGQDGFDVYQALRELPGHRRTPILFLSGSTAEADVTRGLELGAADYITKPIAPGVLRAKVEAYLKRGQTSRPIAGSVLEQAMKRKKTTRRSTIDLAMADAPPEVREAAQETERCFDKYVLLDEAGIGSMGIVIRAWDCALRDMVALKFVRHGVSQELVERLYREARNVIRLSHDHIIRVHDIREVDGRHFIAMQYVAGQAADRKFAPAEAARLLLPVALAVDHAHGRGIVHRDIKPANILIDETGKPWISDFGISISLRDDPASAPLAGSPSYMAPEQTGLIGGRVTPLSDVWALGSTLYHLLTGQPPFAGIDTTDVLEGVVSGAVVPPTRWEPAIPPALEQVCLRAMRIDPAERFQSAAELARALRARLGPVQQLRAWLFGGE